MNLRHKKPINSYKGQTNNDKSEFNDDDFKQQGSPHKKNNTGSTEQIYKYAKILYKFVKIINQDFRTYDYSNADQRLSNSHQKRIGKSVIEEENQMSLSFGKTEQNKQIKQLGKLQQRIQIKTNSKIVKTPHKQIDELQQPSSSKPTPQPKLHDSAQPFKDRKKLNDLKDTYLSTQSVNKDKKQTKTNLNKPPSNGSMQKSNANTLPKVEGSNHVPPPINYVDNSLLNYFNMSGILPQNVFQSSMPIFGVNQIDINQLLGQYPGQANMLRDSAMGLNLGVIGINGLGISPNHLYPEPIQNLFSQQVKNYNSAVNNSNIPKGEHDKVYAKRVYPLKRNAYHVTIAYKIYLDKLKKDGVNIQNLEQIDPTRNARRIKSSQGAKGVSKQSVKKKK